MTRYTSLLFLAALVPQVAQGTFTTFTIFETDIDFSALTLIPGASDQLCHVLNFGPKYSASLTNTTAGDNFSIAVCDDGSQMDFYGTVLSPGEVTYEYYVHDSNPPQLLGNCNNDVASVTAPIPCTVAGKKYQNTERLNCNSNDFNMC
jgi:hypothetical protein